VSTKGFPTSRERERERERENIPPDSRAGANRRCAISMRMFLALVGMLVAVGAPNVALPTMVAAQQGVTFTTDQPSYGAPSDTHAVVTVSGLTDCGGQQVDIGFFAGDLATPLGGSPTSVAVAADGTAEAQVVVPGGLSSEYPVGVVGSCVPGGGVLSNFTVFIGHVDPTQTAVASPSPSPTAAPSTPQPPATGSGGEDAGDAWPWIAVGAAAVLLAAAGSAAVLRRSR
jgi:hypothetical protein